MTNPEYGGVAASRRAAHEELNKARETSVKAGKAGG